MMKVIINWEKKEAKINFLLRAEERNRVKRTMGQMKWSSRNREELAGKKVIEKRVVQCPFERDGVY